MKLYTINIGGDKYDLENLYRDYEFEVERWSSTTLVEITDKSTSEPSRKICSGYIKKLSLSKSKKSAIFHFSVPSLAPGTKNQNWKKPFSFKIIVSNEKGIELQLVRTENTWITERNVELNGPINQFCTSNNKLKSIGVDAFPYLNLPFISRLGVGELFERNTERWSFGVFVLPNNALSIVCVATGKLSEERGSPSNFRLRSVGSNDESSLRFRNTVTQRVVSLLNILPLSECVDWVHVWHAFSEGGCQPFFEAYNRAVNASRIGLWQSRNDLPWVVNPKVLERGKLSALYFFGGDGQKKYWKAILPLSADEQDNEVEFAYQWKETGEISAIRGKLECFTLPFANQNHKNDPIPSNNNSLLIKKILPLVQNIASGDAQTAIAANVTIEFDPELFNDTLGNFGAINLRLRTNKDKITSLASLTLRLRSGLDPEKSLLFASSELKDLPVTVALANRSDAKEKISKFDISDDAEEALILETDSIIRMLEPKANEDTQPDNGPKLNIKSESRFGSRENVRLEIKSTDNSFNNTRISFFQAKPFLYVAVSELAHDPEAGSLVAQWNSEDDEGPQWRIPYTSVVLELPAQSVGESMERGNRFWDVPTKSNIDKEKPVPFRFSPPTRIEFVPEAGQRRYKEMPNNVFNLIHDASVHTLYTELIYPVSVRYKRSDTATIDLRLKETGKFLGRSVPSLPVYKKVREQPSDVFDASLAQWVAASNPNISDSYRLLRLNNTAAKANFVSRIAQIHLVDGHAPSANLLIREDISFTLRSHKLSGKTKDDSPWISLEGAARAPALLNPLPKSPREVDVTRGKERILAFLSGKDEWGTSDQGAICGGVLHSIEFPSELVAILRQPHSSKGWIGDVSFSNMGVTGKIEVAFDEGRTTFTAEVENGQIAKLLRTRIGRIGIVWSRAKHIIVYERTVLPSEQFDSEQQCAPFPGWPLLRKTEEYIEPIDVTRAFANEPESQLNKTGFIDEFLINSPRIYVNSAWGEELEGENKGYKIPLWQPNLIFKPESPSTSQVFHYPKPSLAFVSREQGSVASRQWVDDPDELFFYTITTEGAGAEPDHWPAIAGVDAPIGIFRTGVLTKKPEGKEWNSFIQSRATQSPQRDAMRRRFFDLRVSTDAAVNLQAKRSEKPMFAHIGLVSLARSAEQASNSAAFKINTSINKKFEALQQSAEWSGRVQHFTAPLKTWVNDFPQKMLQFSCQPSAKAALLMEINALEQEAKEHLAKTFKQLPKPPLSNSAPCDLMNKLMQDITGVTLLSPQTLVVYANETRDYLRNELLRQVLDEVDKNELVKQELEQKAELLLDKFEASKNLIENQIIKSATQAKLEVEQCATEFSELSASIDKLVAAVAAIEDDSTVLAGEIEDLKDKIKDLKDKVKAAKEKLTEIQKVPYVRFAAQAISVLDFLEGFLGLSLMLSINTPDQLVAGLKLAKNNLIKLKIGLTALKSNLKSLSDVLSKSINGLLNDFSRAIENLRKLINVQDPRITPNQLRELINEIALHLDDGGLNSNAYTMAALSEANVKIQKHIEDTLRPLANALVKVQENALGVYDAAVKKYIESTDNAQSWFDSQITEVAETTRKAIEVLPEDNSFCEKFKKVQSDVLKNFSILENTLANRLSNFCSQLIDEQTRQKFAALQELSQIKLGKLREDFPTLGKLDRGLKLAKAIGDMPCLPDLRFNVDKAEYVFDDLANQIETSPFGARVKEISGGLRELGINIPSTQLLDDVIPYPEDIQASFSNIVNSIGGMEFAGLFEKFKLPQLKREHYQITHGIDEKSRTAWMKANVDVGFAQREAMFEVSGIGVFTEQMHLKALSERKLRLDGRQDSVTNGAMTANWVLHVGGVDMATFKQVTINYDGDKLTFDIKPQNIEYHPSLRFISDVAQKLDGTMPAGVKLLKDARGLPIGAEARLETTIENPPPLGPVLLGPLTLNSGLALMLENKGDFTIRAFAGVGSKERPIFCQISWLGGGAWLTCILTNYRDEDGRKTNFGGSVGVALGSMRAFNVGGIAKGSYSFLLYVNADFSNRLSIIRAGLSVRGGARVLSLVNVYVDLLLEAEHSSEGGATGTGRLSVSAKISPFYTLRINKVVKQRF